MELMDICTPCAKQIEHGKKKLIKRGIDNKITCGVCGRRRYGATYSVDRQEAEQSPMEEDT